MEHALQFTVAAGVTNLARTLSPIKSRLLIVG